ncbi:MAG: N-acetylmuramoyl-L-alanine amidase [Hyphomonadaceae bacterium]
MAFAPAAADPSLTLSGLQVERAGAGARVIVDLTGEAEAQAFLLPQPQPRLVIDLPAATWAEAQPPAAAGLVRAVRHAAEGGRTRIVLDLARQAEVTGVERIAHARGLRLVYALAPGVAAAPPPAMSAARPPALSAPRQAGPPPARGARKVVVIDPGHGGKDPGAIAVNGRHEKDFNLAAALALKAALQRRGGYDVVLTRDDDTFVALPDRVRIARDRKADLFISLHSDAESQGQARGATVYALSQSGGARAKALANSQDWGVDLGEPAAPRVNEILLDLTQRETIDQSTEFARSLIASLAPVAPLTTRAARRAGFFVLLAPDVPAILLEMGYVTQPDDARRLADPQARRTMMEAVAEAVDGYFGKPATYATVSMATPSFGAASPP